MKVAEKGVFYAVGIGPGCPDLLTVRAVNIIASADVIIAPRSELADKSLALESIREYIDTGKQEIIEHVYPMTRDNASTVASWSGVAEIIAAKVAAGLSVVQITLGDPDVYSTSTYLINCLKQLMPAEAIKVIPGISAFQAAAAKFNDHLCLQEDRVMLMPGTDLKEVEAALANCETLVLYKAGRNIGRIRDLLAAKGLLSQAKAAFYVEQEGEVLWSDMSRDMEYEGKYMTVVLIHCGSREW